MITVDIKTGILREVVNIHCIVSVALDVYDVGVSIETDESCMNLIDEIKLRDETITDSAFQMPRAPHSDQAVGSESL